MKKAFTMIELIFVIVILGILAAVALPKFIGVSSQAHEANLKNFVGTLNGTLGPSWWSKAMPSGGDVSTLDINTTDELKKYTDLPKELSSWNLNNCNDANNYKVIGEGNTSVIGSTENYYIICKDGAANYAPKFMLIKTAQADTLSLGDANTSAPSGTSIGMEGNISATIVQQ